MAVSKPNSYGLNIDNTCILNTMFTSKSVSNYKRYASGEHVTISPMSLPHVDVVCNDNNNDNDNENDNVYILSNN